MSLSSPSGPVRYGMVYATVYLGTGIATPYMPAWFRSVGLDGTQIGLVLAVPMLARILTGPVVAFAADGFGQRRTPILFLALAAATTYALLPVTANVPVIAALWFIAATAISSMSPLIDVVVLRRASAERFTYALPRGIGSAAYVVGNVATGLLLIPFGATIAVAGAAASALLSAAAVRLLLPGDPVHDRVRLGLGERVMAFRSLLADRRFILIIVTAGLIQGGNAFYYGFSTLIWRGQGLSSGAIGLLWGLGVACEVAFLWGGEGWRRKFGPEGILIVAATASVLRWSTLAMSPPLALLWPLQALHALTLSAPFVAALQLVDRVAPRQSASAAQQLNAALSSGLIMGVATLAGGWLYDASGARGYFLMSAMAVAGLFGALALRRSPELLSPAAPGLRASV